LDPQALQKPNQPFKKQNQETNLQAKAQNLNQNHLSAEARRAKGEPQTLQQKVLILEQKQQLDRPIVDQQVLETQAHEARIRAQNLDHFLHTIQTKIERR